MAYQKGSLVVYGIHGVCEIVDTEVRNINRNKVEYFVLQPIEQPESRFYVPTANPAAVAKMSPILTPDQIKDLLSNCSDRHAWIADENQRKQHYKTLISSGDRTALVGMIRRLYVHREQQKITGRKFHLCDENFLRDAERLIAGEIALVMNISREDASVYIRTQLNADT